MGKYETTATRVALSKGPADGAPDRGNGVKMETTASRVDLAKQASPLDFPASEGKFESTSTKVDLDRTPHRGIEDYPMSKQSDPGSR